MTDSTLDAILRAIFAEPAEDTPRLAYADRLDEIAGDMPNPEAARARAEFIRVMVEYARLDSHDHGRNRRHSMNCDVCEQRAVVAKRERELWVTADGNRWVAAPCLEGFDFRLLPDDLDQSTGRPHLKCCYYSRGFVAGVTLPAADWLACGDAILAAHPVVRVELTSPIDWYQDGNGAVVLHDGQHPRRVGDNRRVCQRAKSRPGELQTVPKMLSEEWPRIPADGWALPPADPLPMRGAGAVIDGRRVGSARWSIETPRAVVAPGQRIRTADGRLGVGTNEIDANGNAVIRWVGRRPD